MTYELAFDRRALKEWQKLGHTIREQFKETGRTAGKSTRTRSPVTWSC